MRDGRLETTGHRLKEPEICNIRARNLFLTQSVIMKNLSLSAEVVKLVDAVDSKSTGFITRAGSSPAFGTIIKEAKKGVATQKS